LPPPASAAVAAVSSMAVAPATIMIVFMLASPLRNAVLFGARNNPAARRLLPARA